MANSGSGKSPSSEGPVVVGIGEVLFDCFPDRMVLGGAPVNVAVHVHQLLSGVGGQGVVVSRVGEDDLGKDLVTQLNDWGLVTNLIQQGPELPTGTVQISVDATGEPTYCIEQNVAWENICFEESLERLACLCDAVCFGSLAQRNEPSRSTIHRFLRCAKSAIRLFDVNLRQSYYSAEVLHASFQAANVVKLNRAELAEVGKQLNAKLGTTSDSDLAVQRLQEAYALDSVALTRGSDGTVLYHRGSRFEADSITIQRDSNADNVGAGDACSAGLVYGLIRGWEPERILELANRMGAFVASKAGATPRLSEELINF